MLFVNLLTVGDPRMSQVSLANLTVQLIHLNDSTLLYTGLAQLRHFSPSSSRALNSSLTVAGSALPRTSPITRFIILANALPRSLARRVLFDDTTRSTIAPRSVLDSIRSPRPSTASAAD